MDVYHGRRWHFKARFWLAFWRHTLTTPRITRLAALRLRGENITMTGLAHLPADGPFVLAANHFNGRPGLDVGAAVLNAAARIRPDAVDAMLIVIGQRRGRRRTLLRRVLDRVYGRWSHHVIRIALRNERPDIQGLRDWRRRNQPVFLFPEGRGQLTFGQVRTGAARWISRGKMPVIPVAVWWRRDDGWQVRFGSPLVWAARDDLRDAQLGLAISALLPQELAPDWQAVLARWRAIHAAQPVNQTLI